jgi:hypothetical protein
MLCFTEMYRNYFRLTACNVGHNKFQKKVLFLVSNVDNIAPIGLGIYCSISFAQKFPFWRINTVPTLRFSSEEQVAYIMSGAIYDTHSHVCLAR